MPLYIFNLLFSIRTFRILVTQLWVCLKHRCPPRPQVEHASLSVVLRVLKAEMPKKDRISPVRNTYLAHPLPFLPVLLTPILSVRSVILLGRRKKERCRTRRQEAEGPLRRSRGQHLILPRYGQSSVKVRSAGRATQPPLLGRWRKVRTLPLSIFCMAWFIGF